MAHEDKWAYKDKECVHVFLVPLNLLSIKFLHTAHNACPPKGRGGAGDDGIVFLARDDMNGVVFGA